MKLSVEAGNAPHPPLRASGSYRSCILPILLFWVGVAGAQQVSERARELHRQALVFDAHVHMANRQFYHGGDIGDRLVGGQVDLPRAREGGLKAMFFSIFVHERYYPARYETKQALRLIDLALDQIEKNKADIALAMNASDIERIVKEGRIAAVLDIEGGFDLDGDLGVLRMLHRLGLRSAQLPAHNWTNHFADSCCAPPKWNGLNDQGRTVVREMNRLGMVINISHASDETMRQVIELSSDPVVATHHGLRSFNNIPRTMPDDILKLLASRGGVIAFHVGNEFHNRALFDYQTGRAGKPFWDTRAIGRLEASLSIHEIDKMLAARRTGEGAGGPDELIFSVDDWFRVVDRAIEVAGEDHVALGSDFDGGPTLPKPMRDIRDLPMLTDAMLRRGYTPERTRKFLGGNLLRVFREVTEAK
ncbi:MAG: dipeptidase [Bryobacterales bacterium]|nr:dipeptidase [Bryobacterales bacterium]